MAKIKPFSLRLKKISQEDISLHEGLSQFLPAHNVQGFASNIRQSLIQYLPDVRFYVERIQSVTSGSFLSQFTSPCCLGVVGLEPFDQKGFIEIDPVLSSLAIDRVLGGKGEDLDALRPLTEMEQGVVQFLLLKVFAAIQLQVGEKARMHFRLQELLVSPNSLHNSVDTNLDYVCLKVHVALFGRAGFCNIYLPHPWLLEGWLSDLDVSQNSDNAAIRVAMQRYSSFELPLFGVVGKTDLTLGDLQHLESGDVVLLDETHVESRGGSFSGTLELSVSFAESGGFSGRWNGFENGGRCVISGVGLPGKKIL